MKKLSAFYTNFWQFSIEIPICLPIFAHLGPNFKKSEFGGVVVDHSLKPQRVDLSFQHKLK